MHVRVLVHTGPSVSKCDYLCEGAGVRVLV